MTSFRIPAKDARILIGSLWVSKGYVDFGELNHTTMRSKLFLLLVVFLGQIVQMVAQDGCTDPLACNYDQSAQTDDGSCCFGSCMELTMNDAFGDGWDNAVLTITTDAGTEVLNATMDIGFTQVLKFCLDDDCYVVNVSAGTFPSEISWSISGTNMGTITGGAPGVSDFSAGALAECGCTDPSACNYAPAATTDDGTCLYGDSCWGCIDPEAVNYDPVAIWDDGNCHYTTQGVVYYDTNIDGMKGQLEPGIANKAVFITETGSTLYTDEFGFLYLSDLPAGDYTLNYIPEPEWNNTSPIVQIVTLPDDGSPASFGLYPVGSDLLFESGMYYTPSFIHCTSGLNFGFFYTNLREGDFTVTVSVSFDEMFVPEEGIGTLPPTTSGPGFATWVISNPGLGIMQEMGLHIPGPDFIDDVVAKSDRSPAVMRSLNWLFNHGRLAGTGCLDSARGPGY